MGIFSAIMDKIFQHPAAQPAEPAPAPAEAAAAPAEAAPAPAAPAAAPASEPVDVEAVLAQMAADSDDGGGNWQESIVDLLHLLGLDSSLSARKELANELNVHVDDDGTAEENTALHHAVMEKLAENGGKVPDSLKGA